MITLAGIGRKGRFPSDGQTLHIFRCKLCQKLIREQLNDNKIQAQFLSRLQHLFAKHGTNVDAFLTPFFTYQSEKEAETDELLGQHGGVDV